MNCPNCKKSYFWGEASIRSMFASNDAFSCRNCDEKTELIEDAPSDDISHVIFSVIRCGIVPIMLAALPLELFGSSPFFASIGYVMIILWALREREKMHYFLRLVSVENVSDPASLEKK
jgi:hypothetical protein